MTRLYGVGALLLALAAHGELLIRLRRAEAAHPWWFGYARDGANLAAALMLWGAYLMIGFAAPVALLAGMLTCLGTYVIDWVVAQAMRVTRARIVIWLVVAAWATVVALAPTQIQSGFEALLLRGRP
jgi:hypothetical protein